MAEMSLRQMRAQFPQYDDLSDEALATGIYNKFYSDMDRAEFDRRIGLAVPDVPVPAPAPRADQRTPAPQLNPGAAPAAGAGAAVAATGPALPRGLPTSDAGRPASSPTDSVLPPPQSPVQIAGPAGANSTFNAPPPPATAPGPVPTAAAPPPTAAATLPGAPDQDTSTAAGDLEAGMLMLRQVIPGLQAVAGLGQQSAARQNQQGAARAIAEIEQRLDLARRQGNAQAVATLERERDYLRSLSEMAPGQTARGAVNLAEGATEIAGLQQQIEQIAMNPAAQRLSQAETFSEGIDAWASDPWNATRSLVLRSLPASAPAIGGAVVGGVTMGPAGGAAGGFFGDASVEFGLYAGQEMTAAAQADGVDVSDEAAMTAWVRANPERVGKIAEDALIRAGIIGAAGAVSGGVASVIARSVVSRGVGTQAAATLGSAALIEAPIEGVGEAAAQLATTGQIEPGEVLAEVVGGAGQGVAMTGGGIAAERAVQALRGDSNQTEQQATPAPQPATTAQPTAQPDPAPAPAQPIETQAAQPQTAPVQSGQPASLPPTEQPTQATTGQTEVMDEIGADGVPTGRQVVVDMQTGQVSPLEQGTSAAAPTEQAAPQVAPVTVDQETEQPVQATTDQPIITRPVGEVEQVSTASGRQVPVQYAIVELDTLTPSNLEDGRINPAFPQDMQPRDRTRPASQQQVRDIAQNLQPELLDRSPMASDGAPIIDPSGVVESGNGRILALQQAYTRDRLASTRYRQHLMMRGYPVSNMRQPVLVRVRQGQMTSADRAEFTREANERTTLGMSDTEQAMADSTAMPASALALFRGGDIDLASNRDFVRAFIGEVVGENDQAAMIDAEGRISQNAVRRVQAALLARAYGDAALVATLIESADTNIKAIGGALMDVSARWAQMRALAQANQISPDMDQTDALLEAVRIVDRARSAQRNVAEFVGQDDLLTGGSSVSPMGMDFLRLFFRDTEQWARPAGRQKIADALQFYVDEAEQTSPGADLLGQTAEPGPVLQTAKGRQYGSEEQQDSLFDAPDQADRQTGRSDGARPREAGRDPGLEPGRTATSPDQRQPDTQPRSDVAQREPRQVTPKPNRAPKRKAATAARADTQLLSDADEARLAELKAQFKAKITTQVNSGLDPALVAIAAEMAALYIKKGARKFRQLTEAMMEDLGLSFEQAQPYARVAYNQVRDDMDLEGADVSEMDSGPEVVAQIRQMRSDAREGINEPAPGNSLERDSGNAGTADVLGDGAVSASAGGSGRGDGDRSRSAAGRRDDATGGGGVSADRTAAVGGAGDTRVPGDGGTAQRGADADGDAERGRDSSKPGLRADDGRTEPTENSATDGASRLTADPADQPTDHHREVAKAVPALRDEQVDDVVRIERRFFRPEPGKKFGHGILITNGTGTGKTMTGLGFVKRRIDAGASAILAIVKTQGEVQNWLDHGPLVDLDVKALTGIQDNGGNAKVVVTTYANMYDNPTLADREWDDVIADESHMLSQNAAGDETEALKMLRAITAKPTHLIERELMRRRDRVRSVRSMANEEARARAWQALYDEARKAADVERKRDKRANVVFMSATPFAYDKSVDYGESYLFDYPKDESRQGSRQSGRNWFMVENFGYRIRYHKLTLPESAVDRGVFHRQFHERLKAEGALWGRALEVTTDYDRKFVAVENDLGNKIDQALKYLSDQSLAKNSAHRKAPSPESRKVMQGWDAVRKKVNDKFDFLSRMQLLEAMRAEAAIPDIREHLKMGRKVVVFHDYNKGGARSPFEIAAATPAEESVIAQMHRDLPWLKDLDFGRLPPAKAQILTAFRAQAVEYNGTVSRKNRQAAKDRFNADGSGIDVITVQSDAGSGGISLHDTTGGHMRVLINLGMPTKPTTSLQAEGRTRRVGSVSDSPYRYYTIGTAWERAAFAQRIAEQSGAVEDLAMGDAARSVRQSFITAYEEADTFKPSDTDGQGGRDADLRTNVTSEYDKAKTHYFGRQKMKGKRDQRQGIDFFPTPEPLSFKMVEWAGIREGEAVLEPSAGDGSIARYFPASSDRTIVEPSLELSSRAQLLATGARAVTSTFEDLSIVNKYDAVVMNPPFGSGGKTAFEHVRKAARHLRQGGRTVALVPAGTAADKRKSALMEELEDQGYSFTAEVTLPPVTFERAGTNVSATVMIIDRVPREGATRTITMTGSKTIADFFDRLEGIAGPGRPESAAAVQPAPAVSNAALTAQPKATDPLSDDQYTFETFEFFHTKTGKNKYGVQIAENLGDEFRSVAAVAKGFDGYYSRYQNKAAGAQRGFLFNSDADRESFLDALRRPVQGDDSADQPVNTRTQQPRPGVSAADPDAIAHMMPVLRAELDRLKLSRVNLGIDRSGLERQGATVVRQLGEIDILIGQAIDPLATLYHEAIHAMKAMNLFTPREWDALSRAARGRWVQKHDIAQRYPGLTPTEMIEEAIAEEFAERATARRAPGNSLLVQAFNKIARMLKAIRNALRGLGLQTPDAIFDAVIAGQIASRSIEASSVSRTMDQAAPVPAAAPLPVHIPDRGVWNELITKQASIFDRLRGAGGALNDKVDAARLAIQDRFLPVYRAQQGIERSIGAPLPDSLNAYQAETTFSGRAGRQLFEIDEDYTKPIVDIIARTEGLTADDVGTWLMARHAKERNDQIAQINVDMPDGGSGMTNDEAADVLNTAAAGPFATQLNEIGNLIDRLRERTLKLRHEAGLLTDVEYQLWTNQYQFYVPLRGFAETDHAEASLDLTGVGRRYNIRGPESMRALGRRSIAFNPLIAAITQAQEVAIRAEKNRVSQAVYRLASQHSSPNLWTVRTPQQKRFFNRATGLVETRVVNPTDARLEPNEFALKLDGKEKRIVLHDDRLVTALGAIGSDQMSFVTQIAAFYTRLQSMVNTMLNPEFVVRNAFRDFTAAQVNLPVMTGDDRKGFGRAVAKNWHKAFLGAYRGMGNKVDSEWTRWFEEFDKAGGKISFWTLDNPMSNAEDIERRIRLARGNAAMRALKTMTSPRALVSTRDNPLLGFIERTNLAVDNAVRVATYAEARKRGWSEQRAANLAKNLTVNFNRRGTYGTLINSWYLFFNAAIQGLQVLMSVMTTRRGALIGLGGVMFGIALDLVNAGLSEEDDDGELAYDKIPDHKLRRNLVLMALAGEDAVAAPLPYTYSLFPYAGTLIGKVFRGKMTASEAFQEMLIATLSDVSPTGFGSFSQSVLPTIMSDMSEFALNEDWLGRNIRPENPFGDYGPQAYKYYAGASETSKAVTDWLNRQTGGSVSESGSIDISPEYVDHFMGTLTGGAGRFWGETADAVQKALTGQGELIDTRQIPWASDVFVETGPWYDRRRFYEASTVIRDAHARAKLAEEAGERVPLRYRRLAALNTDANRLRRRLSELRRKRQVINGLPNLTTEDRTARLLAVERQEQRIYDALNRRFLRTMRLLQ
ncbi:MAG: LPD38 domain-containing protein [Pseudomonadota bacterium]